MTEIIWTSPTDPVHLENTQVHLWKAESSSSNIDSRTLWLTLSEDEQDRAKRFHRQVDGDRYIWHHATLHQILSRYLDLHPREINFQYSALGKPSLPKEINPNRYCFNMSHSGDILIIGLTSNLQIGVDVERISSIPDMEAMVELNFTQTEIKAYSRLPETEKQFAFFAAWTRKEAVLKAVGKGLQIPPGQIEVSMDPEESSPSVRLLDEVEGSVSFRLFSFRPAEGHQAALAVEGINWDVKAFQYG